MSETSTLISCTGKITRAELAKPPTPPATETHIPIAHAAVVETLIETLGHRHIGVVGEEFAVSAMEWRCLGLLTWKLASKDADLRLEFGTLTTNDSGWHAQSDCGYLCVTTSHSEEITHPSWRNTRSISRSTTLSRSV